MPYDAQWPQNGQMVDADRFREQFGGLKALIDALQGGGITGAVVDGVTTLPPGSPANVGLSLSGSVLHFTFDVPAGLEGPAGPQGLPFAAAVVDGVNTVGAGMPAAVNVTFDGSAVRFTFDIPRGQDGTNGTDGSDGSQGPPGNDGGPGPQGPAFALAVVDAVTTLDPGLPATVQTSFDGLNVHFSFGIPRGEDGTNGSNGAPGEVSQAQLDTAIHGTSANTNSIATLDTVFADPELEAVRQKINEIILNGRRL